MIRLWSPACWFEAQYAFSQSTFVLQISSDVLRLARHNTKRQRVAGGYRLECSKLTVGSWLIVGDRTMRCTSIRNHCAHCVSSTVNPCKGLAEQCWPHRSLWMIDVSFQRVDMFFAEILDWSKQRKRDQNQKTNLYHRWYKYRPNYARTKPDYHRSRAL